MSITLLLFLLAFATWYLVFNELMRRCPQGLLSNSFGTERKATLATRNSFTSGTITLTRDGDKRFVSPTNDIYYALLSEGFLICGGWLGDALRLNRNVLIPWSAMEISRVPVGKNLPKSLKVFASEYYIAKIETRDGIFRLHLDSMQFKEVADKGWLSPTSILR